MNIKMTSDNEWDVEGGDLNFIDGVEEITQIVKQRLLFFFGEWFLNTGRGVKYYEEILKKRVNGSKIDGELIKAISECPGIINIDKYDSTFDPATRQLSVSCKLQSVEGEINFDEVIL